MRKSAILTAVAALLPATVLAGTYYIDNYCPFTMYLQSTSTPADGPVPLVTLAANTRETYSEVMRDAAYSINALTISRTPDFASPMQATYHQTTDGPAPGYNFYAMSEIFGAPLITEGFQLVTPVDGFGINCPPRTDGTSCPFTYSASNPNGDHAVFWVTDWEDLRLLLCQYSQNGTVDEI